MRITRGDAETARDALAQLQAAGVSSGSRKLTLTSVGMNAGQVARWLDGDIPLATLCAVAEWTAPPPCADGEVVHLVDRRSPIHAACAVGTVPGHRVTVAHIAMVTCPRCSVIDLEHYNAPINAGEMGAGDWQSWWDQGTISADD